MWAVRDVAVLPVADTVGRTWDSVILLDPLTDTTDLTLSALRTALTRHRAHLSVIIPAAWSWLTATIADPAVRDAHLAVHTALLGDPGAVLPPARVRVRPALEVALPRSGPVQLHGGGG